MKEAAAGCARPGGRCSGPGSKSSDVSDSQEVESGNPLNLLPVDPQSIAVGLFVVLT